MNLPRKVRKDASLLQKGKYSMSTCSDSTDVVVAGHICFDIIPEIITGGNTISDIFRPGKLVRVGSASVSSGGPVSNTGLALNRLGIGVKLMGKCGNDMFGHSLVQCIREEAAGAEKGMRMVDGEVTSYTVVVSPPGIDRFFLHCSGANDTFGADDIDIPLDGWKYNSEAKRYLGPNDKTL